MFGLHYPNCIQVIVQISKKVFIFCSDFPILLTEFIVRIGKHLWQLKKYVRSKVWYKKTW